MYSWIRKSNLLVLFMAFAALTYFTTAYSTEYRLLAREEERQGEGREGGEERGGGEYGGGQNRGAYHPGQQGGYSNYGRSYSQQDRSGAAFGAGAVMGSEGNQNNQGNVQYVPQPQPPNSTQPSYQYNQGGQQPY